MTGRAFGRVYKRKGTSRWWLDYKNSAGQRVRRSASTESEDDARELLRKVESDAWKVRKGLTPKGSNEVLLSELLTEYRRYVRQYCRRSTCDGYAKALKMILKALGRRTVQEITPRLIEQYQQARAVHVSNRTVNRDVGALKTMLSWAERTERIAGNPIRRVRMLHKDPVKVRRALSEEEIDKLFDASKPAPRLLWRTFLETGLRHGELTALHWTDLDLDGGTIHVRGEIAKTHQPRFIPLAGPLLIELRALKERTMWHGQNTRPWVFLNALGRPWRHSSILHAFQHCLERAGIAREGLDVHALRHTFATRLWRRGVDTKTIQDLLGHATWQMTQGVYLHSSETDRREAVERLSKSTDLARSGHSASEQQPDGSHSEKPLGEANA